MTTYPRPAGGTARRLEWAHLPPALRAEIERRIGTRVVRAESQTSGFTPGFASVLHGADGSCHFVKAASTKAQAMFAASYREEARKLAVLPPGVPAPRLRWLHDAGDWVVLGIEYVAARTPDRPWTTADLERSLAAVIEAGRVLTPVPAGLALHSFAEEFHDFPAHWDGLDRTYVLPRAAEAAALAARYEEVVGGDTVVHTDVRDDNLLLVDDGRTLICDWNWPVAGAAWIDPLLLLIGPRGDGLDVGGLLAEHPVFAGVDPEAVDIVLALVTGYFLASAALPAPTYSPHIREHQLWQGDVTWSWLCERRGWPES